MKKSLSDSNNPSVDDLRAAAMTYAVMEEDAKVLAMIVMRLLRKDRSWITSTCISTICFLMYKNVLYVPAVYHAMYHSSPEKARKFLVEECQADVNLFFYSNGHYTTLACQWESSPFFMVYYQMSD